MTNVIAEMMRDWSRLCLQIEAQRQALAMQLFEYEMSRLYHREKDNEY